MSRKFTFLIGNDFDSKKVLHYLRGSAGLSSHLIRALKQIPNGILLNGEHIRTIDILKTGDVLTVNLPDDEKIENPSDTELNVLYEDADIIIIDKPALMPIHPSHNHQGDTLANATAGHLQKNGEQATFRAIGRLDKGTSGIVVCAKNSYCASKLQGKIKKEYLAIAGGIFNGSGTIDQPIYRPDPIKTIRIVDERGDRAVTHWQAISGDDKSTLLRINLETGRTHQIRVHFAFLGAPLVGDSMYGSCDNRLNRHALHCEKVCFKHPISGNNIDIISQIPEDMENIIMQFDHYMV